MNLQPVYPARPEVKVQCCKCGKWVPSTEALADLEGKPFEAYYCQADTP